MLQNIGFPFKRELTILILCIRKHYLGSCSKLFRALSLNLSLLLYDSNAFTWPKRFAYIGRSIVESPGYTYIYIYKALTLHFNELAWYVYICVYIYIYIYIGYGSFFRPSCNTNVYIYIYLSYTYIKSLHVNINIFILYL